MDVPETSKLDWGYVFFFVGYSSPTISLGFHPKTLVNQIIGKGYQNLTKFPVFLAQHHVVFKSRRCYLQKIKTSIVYYYFCLIGILHSHSFGGCWIPIYFRVVRSACRSSSSMAGWQLTLVGHNKAKSATK